MCGHFSKIRKLPPHSFYTKLVNGTRIQMHSLWGNILIEFLRVLTLNSGVIFILDHGGLTTQFY